MSYSGTPVVVTTTSFTQPGGTPQVWVKYTKAFGDFTDAGLFKELALYTLPIGGVIHAIKTKHSVAFSGGGAAVATVEVGIAGDTDRYAPAFNVFQAVAANTFQYATVNMSENHTATTAMTVTLRSNVALNTLAAGSVTIWLLISTAV
jgi:hypothetical protein